MSSYSQDAFFHFRPCLYLLSKIHITHNRTHSSFPALPTSQFFGSIHYGGQWPGNTYTTHETSRWRAAQYNDVGITWSKKAIHWYINDKLVGSAYSGNGTTDGWFSSAPTAGPDAPFDKKFYLLINMALGGSFTGSPDVETVSKTLVKPKAMYVDWVRVWGSRDG